jgi:molecular chaperone DnaJ
MCRACSGSGKLQSRSYRVQVRIPHGVRDGDLLHVDARRARPSPPPAALEIVVTLLSHAFFELDEDGTIRCEMPVDGFAWIANRLIQVPTLSGLKPLQLSRDRLAYRLKNQGFPVERRGARGDQIVTLVPVFPEQLSTDQQILLDQLSATSSRADGRLRAWNQGLRTWERKLPRQGPPGS